MTVTTGALPSQLLAPGLRKVFFASMEEKIPMEFAGTMNVLSSTRNFEEDIEGAPMGTLQQKPEGTPTIYVDPVYGAVKRYTWTPWSLGFRATKEAREDEKYGTITKTSKRLGISARQTQEILGIGPLNDAFAAGVTGFKAQALCNTAHTLLNAGGATSSNRLSPDAALGITSLQDAKILMEQTVDETGAPIPLIPKTLVIPEDLMIVADEILRSRNRPYTSENTINVLYQDFGMQVNHYLTDANNWFLLASMHDMKVFYKNRPEFSNGDDFDTGDAKFKVYLRMGTGFGDWRGVVGSAPA